MPAIKERQISVRVPAETDAWLEQRAGGKRKKAAFLRELIEREMALHREHELLAMFNRAAGHLKVADLEERESLLAAFSGRD